MTLRAIFLHFFKFCINFLALLYVDHEEYQPYYNEYEREYCECAY